jgi:hypothetical protein
VTESEWLRYLDTLPSPLADLARHIVERCASVIGHEQQRHITIEDSNRNDYNNLRMVVEDQERRLKELERGSHERPA